MAYLKEIQEELDSVNEKLERMAELLKIVNDGYKELQSRATELRNEADTGGQNCPSCGSKEIELYKDMGWRCTACNRTWQF